MGLYPTAVEMVARVGLLTAAFSVSAELPRCSISDLSCPTDQSKSALAAPQANLETETLAATQIRLEGFSRVAESPISGMERVTAQVAPVSPGWPFEIPNQELTTTGAIALPEEPSPQTDVPLLAQTPDPTIIEVPEPESQPPGDREPPSSETPSPDQQPTEPASPSELTPNGEASDLAPGSQPTEFTAADSPLYHLQLQMPTAEHLRRGDVIFNAYNRLFNFPESTADGTGTFLGLGASWGITDKLELTLEAQRVDTGSPGEQGDFFVIRDPEEGDFFLSEFQELTLELKYQLWQKSDQKQALSGVLDLSWGSRAFEFRDGRGGPVVLEDSEESIVPALRFPFTATVDDRWQFTISPTIAFFREENALFLRRPPIDDPGSFGTTFGFAGAVSYRVNPRLILWGDAFYPLAGNNSIDRDSGKPDETFAFNAGLRYLVNPRLSVDLFASNTLGSVGPLALTADQEFLAFGTGVTIMPDFIGSNRRYPDSFRDPADQLETPRTTDGLAFFDGGTLPSGQFLLNLGGGGQGFLTAIRYGILKDAEVGIYLDLISDTIDESEQGISGKLRLLNQAEDNPLTASVGITVGLMNQPFINFFENDRDEFDRRDLDKDVPFIFEGDSIDEGQLFVTTLSLPLHYQFDNGAAVWLTPTLGFVQQAALEIAGFNAGGSVPFARDFSVLAEVGANFAGEGNAFLDDELDDAIPWSVGVRWNLRRLLGKENKPAPESPELEVYVTNRVGFSPFQSLRVRADNETTVGVGLSFPFSF